MAHETTLTAWVESPLQLISAVEYAAHVRSPMLVVMRYGAAQLPATAKRLTELGLPAGVELTSGFASRLPLVAEKTHWVVGDAFSGAFHAALVTRAPQRITIVDDGGISRLLPAVLAGTSPLERPGTPRDRVLATLAASRIRGLNDNDRVEVFSMYDLDVRRASRNTFGWLRSREVASDLTGHVIVGSAAVVDDRMSQRDYLAWLSSLATPAHYLPHRRQSAELLARIAALPGLDVIATGLPIELALLGAHGLHLSSLPSSACDSLAILLDDVTIDLHDATRPGVAA